MNCTLLGKVQSMWLEAYLPDFWWGFIIAVIAYVYNCIPIRHLKWKTPQEIFLCNKPKTLYFYVFGYGVYVFLSSKVHANKLVLCSKLIIFIGYKDNGYCFICHIQGNIIFHSIYAIFDKGLFLKCTNSLLKDVRCSLHLVIQKY